MKNTFNKIGLIALLSPKIKGVANAFIKKNITSDNYFGNNVAEELYDLLKNCGKQFAKELIEEEIIEAEKIVQQCELDNIKIISFLDNNYPAKLKELKDSPAIIYIKGKEDILSRTTVCIIGTREPNENGIRITQKVSEHYKNLNWNICNGLAQGIDSATIQTQDNNSNIIGVVAGGLNFNSQKTLLAKTALNANKVLEANGVIISEQPPNFKEDKFSVVKSCRLQAGLSDGLLLIQSSETGGSKFTIKSFCETHRPLAIINPLPEDQDSKSYGANILIREKGNNGLAEITGLKTDKILTSEIIIIKSKADYIKFEDSIKNNVNTKLF